MAARRTPRRKAITARTSGRGPRGPRGKTGPKGPPGNHAREVARLSAQMEQVVKELQTQLTRIAQIQSQLDRIVARAEPGWTGPERRTSRSN
jgi:ribosomal protein L15